VLWPGLTRFSSRALLCRGCDGGRGNTADVKEVKQCTLDTDMQTKIHASLPTLSVIIVLGRLYQVNAGAAEVYDGLLREF